MIGAIPVMFWPVIVIAFALFLAASWILTRHAVLAVLTVLSPLPGIALAVAVSHRLPFIFEYVPGFIAAGCLASAVAQSSASMPGRKAIRLSLGHLWLPLLASLLFFVPATFTDPTAFACMSAILSAFVVTAAGATVLSYDETFVTRINRASEARIRDTEWLSFVAIPRWGMSIGGIALVFSVLGFFGAQKGSAAILAHPILFAAPAFVFLIDAFAVTRNVRRTLAACLAMAPVLLLVLAASARFARAEESLWLSLAVAAIPVLLMAASAPRFERIGDAADIATVRGIEQAGPAIAVTSLAGAAMATLSTFQSSSGLIEGVVLFFGGIAALVLQPALTTMLYTLVPKRVSLEEAFRKR
jgi:hypothetical protein